MVIGCAITTFIGVKLGAFGYPTPTDDPTNYNFRINEQVSRPEERLTAIALQADC